MQQAPHHPLLMSKAASIGLVELNESFYLYVNELMYTYGGKSVKMDVRLTTVPRE